MPLKHVALPVGLQFRRNQFPRWVALPDSHRITTVNLCVLRVSQLSSTVEYDRLLDRTVRFGKFKMAPPGGFEPHV